MPSRCSTPSLKGDMLFGTKDDTSECEIASFVAKTHVFPYNEKIGPKMLARISKGTGLNPNDL